MYVFRFATRPQLGLKQDPGSRGIAWDLRCWPIMPRVFKLAVALSKDAASPMLGQVRGFGSSVKVLHDKSPATRNRTRDHLISATLYSQMLYQLSYSRLYLLIVAQ